MSTTGLADFVALSVVGGVLIGKPYAELFDKLIVLGDTTQVQQKGIDHKDKVQVCIPAYQVLVDFEYF